MTIRTAGSGRPDAHASSFPPFPSELRQRGTGTLRVKRAPVPAIRLDTVSCFGGDSGTESGQRLWILSLLVIEPVSSKMKGPRRLLW
jgi:hypothetical protein